MKRDALIAFTTGLDGLSCYPIARHAIAPEGQLDMGQAPADAASSAIGPQNGIARPDAQIASYDMCGGTGKCGLPPHTAT